MYVAMLKTKPYRLLFSILLGFFLFIAPHVTYSQIKIDSVFSKLDPQRFAEAVKRKAVKLEQKIVDKSLKVLDKMQSQEEKLYKKMLKGKDSILAKTQLQELKQKYTGLKENMKSPQVLSKTRHYIPKLDSFNTALKFLDANGAGDKVKAALAKTELLKSRFQQAEEIKIFLKQRQEQLRQQMEKLGLVKQLKQINKKIFYFTAQLKEYRQILNDPAKIEKKALELLSKSRWFQDFFRKNSQLASLFRLPDPNNPVSMASIAGLQTRAQVGALIQQQIQSAGRNGAQVFQQQMQSAQGQIRSLQNSIINRTGGESANSADIMPEGFKPNPEKTKSFLKRLELGTNLQTQKGNNYFPNSSDIALSLGYKLNDKSIIGIGASYKLGLGRGWNAIKFSSEGVGLRSFVDWKIPLSPKGGVFGGIWITGGYEMNYRQAFNRIEQLRGLDSWQQSGLLGLSKTVPVKSKFLSRTKVQVLWDMLAGRQVPKAQPVVFRVGYSFK